MIWQVSLRKKDAAASLARKLTGEGRARLHVVAKPAEMPWLKLTGPPLPPASDFLSDVVKALTGDSGEAQPLSPETLERLSWIPGSERGRPTLRRRRPASFVALSPSVEGEIDPESAHLAAVFVDGLEVGGVPR